MLRQWLSKVKSFDNELEHAQKHLWGMRKEHPIIVAPIVVPLLGLFLAVLSPLFPIELTIFFLILIILGFPFCCCVKAFRRLNSRADLTPAESLVRIGYMIGMFVLGAMICLGMLLLLPG